MQANNPRNLISPTVEDLAIYDRLFTRALKFKCFALIVCIVGTVIILMLPLDFLSSKILAIILPAFMTGYAFIHLAGILTACRGHVDLIADLSFSAWAIFVNVCCGGYLLYYWIDFVISTFETGEGLEGGLFLVLSLLCFSNVIAMGGQLMSSIFEMRRRVTSNAGDDDR